MSSEFCDIKTSDDFSIFVVSDGTGKTAYLAVQAALAQFDLPRVKILRFDHVKNKEEIFSILDITRPQKDLVIYTLVNDDFVQALVSESLHRQILVLDLLGPIVNSIRKLSTRSPRGEPGLLHGSNRESVAITEAVEYALAESTGVSFSRLNEAQVIILTVWFPHRDDCILQLAKKGIKCGYMMLNPDLPLPQNMEDILGKDPGKIVIGFIMEPELLQKLRNERIMNLGLNYMEYKANQEVVRQEIKFAQDIYQKLNCPVIDITSLNSKDIINQILLKIQKQREEAE
ncbi:MAG: kinase/pyrophosphorylase [Atribacterota bacterium]|uniref:kinase/pyrophosphorylase n=1 Tax=Atribacter sp. TaxID=2847780 RepID=UPI003D97F99D|nr:kinase/pyrophosphorylase [Atribacterota bacterium]